MTISILGRLGLMNCVIRRGTVSIIQVDVQPLAVHITWCIETLRSGQATVTSIHPLFTPDYATIFGPCDAGIDADTGEVSLFGLPLGTVIDIDFARPTSILAETEPP